MNLDSDRWLAAWSLGYAAVGAASVVVPLYAIELGADAFVVAVIAATGAFAGIPGALLWGRLAARTGRYRPFLLVSLALSAGAFLALPVTRSLPVVVAANAALVFAVSAAAPVLTLLVVAGHTDADWNDRIGVLNTWQGYGWLAGLLAGAAWTGAVTGRYASAVTAQRWFFYGSAGACALATVLAARWLPGKSDVSFSRFGRATSAIERLQRGSGRITHIAPFSGLRSFWALRRLHPRALAARLTPSLSAYLFAAALFFTGFAVFFGPLPAYLADELAMSTDRVFVLFVVSSAASALTYGHVGGIAAGRALQSVQFGAVSARGVLFPAVALVPALGVAPFAPLVVLFAGIGLTWAVVAVTGTGIVARLAPAAVRGDALGAYTALGGLATAVGSLAGGALAAAFGYLVAFGAAAALVLAGGGLALTTISLTPSEQAVGSESA